MVISTYVYMSIKMYLVIEFFIQICNVVMFFIVDCGYSYVKRHTTRKHIDKAIHLRLQWNCSLSAISMPQHVIEYRFLFS